MPNTASARKETRKNERRRAHNRSQRSAMRTAVKRARSAVEVGSYESEESLRLAQKKLDQAVAKGLIHKNAASRTKSRLAKLSKKSKVLVNTSERRTEPFEFVRPFERPAGASARPVEAKKSVIEAPEVTMIGHGPRPMATRIWQDKRTGTEIASVTYNQYADAFTIQWLADFSFEKASSFLDDLFTQHEIPEGFVVAGLRDPKDRDRTSEAAYTHLSVRRGDSLSSIVAGIGVQMSKMFSLSLKTPGLALTFFREASPSLSTANVIATRHESIKPLLAFTLPRVRCVGGPADLNSKMHRALVELPSQLSSTAATRAKDPPEDELELEPADSE